MKFSIRTTLTALIIGATLVSCGQNSKAVEEEESAPVSMIEEEKPMYEIGEEQRTFFVNIEDGEEVSSPLMIQMGVEGMEVEPAGMIKPNFGHHHMIVDGSPIPMGQVVPADGQHIHYGDGRIETELELTPGPHTLTLQFADGVHQSYGEAMSATISVIVKE